MQGNTVTEEYLEPGNDFLQNELERAEFRKHGMEPPSHFFDSLWERKTRGLGKDAVPRITNVTKVHDWRDGKDYLIYGEELGEGNEMAQRTVGGFNLPVIADGKLLKYRPMFTTPFTREAVQAIIKRTDDRTSWGFSELAISESYCKNYREVSACEFLREALE